MQVAPLKYVNCFLIAKYLSSDWRCHHTKFTENIYFMVSFISIWCSTPSDWQSYLTSILFRCIGCWKGKVLIVFIILFLIIVSWKVLKQTNSKNTIATVDSRCLCGQSLRLTKSQLFLSWNMRKKLLATTPSNFLCFLWLAVYTFVTSYGFVQLGFQLLAFQKFLRVNCKTQHIPFLCWLACSYSTRGCCATFDPLPPKANSSISQISK